MGRLCRRGHPKEVSEQYLQAFYEAQQGKGTTTRLKTPNNQAASPALKDQRLEFINASNLRNDLQVFELDPNASGFGQGGASIVGVRFLDSSGEPLSWVIGGELVSLQIDVECQRALASPIVGFTVKDRLGQGLFGDNTFLTYVDNPQPCEAGHRLSARFTFEMPRLAKGDYSVTVAVADGTQHEHVQHHWMHDALVFKSASTSVAAGLIGIPMRSVEMGVCLPVV